MKSYIQFLGTGTLDGGAKSLFLFFDTFRYLFNCSEGTQRFCSEHAIKLGKISTIFLTRLDWDVVGGLPGMISSLADSGISDGLTIVGPRNTCHFVAAMRPFIHRSAYNVSIVELGADFEDETLDNKSHLFTDGNITVMAIEVGPSRSTHSAKRLCLHHPTVVGSVENLKILPKAQYIDTHGNFDHRHFLLQMFRDESHYGEMVRHENRLQEQNRMTLTHRLQHTSPTGTSLCYIVRGPVTPGKFDASAAKKLGVPHGPMNGILSRGESVTLQDGTIVNPDQCIGPSQPGPVFMYFDLPTKDHLESLLDQTEKLDQYFSDKACKMVVWDVDEAVETLPSFGQLLDQFTKSICHVKVQRSFANVFYSPMALISKLQELDDQVFQLPFSRNPSQAVAERFTKCTPLSVLPWMPVSLQPLSLTTFPMTDKEKELGLSAEYPTSIQELDGTLYNPRFTFLGTGASKPGEYRNVSSTVVDIGPNQVVLFDCGEATLGQMLRVYGEEGMNRLLENLEWVLISHLHTDHHAGLLGILLERANQALRASSSTRPLKIMAPQRFLMWLEEYAECIVGGLVNFEFFPIEKYLESGAEFGPKLHVRPVPVEHCSSAYGFVIEAQKGDGTSRTTEQIDNEIIDSNANNDNKCVKIVYSGDTRPCERLVNAGMHASVLIHEATMSDDLQQDAIDKRHSTVSEAVGIGEKMGCKYLVLTHLSQRYSKTVPNLELAAERGNVGIAFDLMSFKFDQLEKVCKWTGRLSALLPEDDEDAIKQPCDYV